MQLIPNLLLKGIVATAFVVAFASWATAQTGTLSGKVTDAASAEPLPFANVFISNTTLGTVTEADGSFVLNNVPFGAVELVVSFVGYKQQTFAFDFQETSHLSNEIRLAPDTRQLTDIEVASEKDKKWERRMARFTRVFLGETDFSRQCKIVNPWVVDLKEDKGTGLVATASAPIEIENNALGYRVFYHLKLFTSGTSHFFFTGDTRFVEMEPTSEKQRNEWDSNRLIAFQGSSRHLFLSILLNYIQMGQLRQEGFVLYRERVSGGNTVTRYPQLDRTKKELLTELPTDNLVGASYRGGLYRISFDGKLEVHFDRQLGAPKNTIYSDSPLEVSWLELKDGFIDVTKEGIAQKPDKLLVSGAMSQGWVAMMLPYDFNPDANNP